MKTRFLTILLLSIALTLSCSHKLTPLSEIDNLSETKLFKEANTCYNNKLYYQSMVRLKTLNEKYPAFEKRNIANYYLGSSYEKLLLDSIALATYEQTINEFPKSQYRDRLLVGVQNIFYKAKEYEKSDSIHTIITNEFDSSSILNESYYISGQVRNAQGKFREATRSFDRVDRLSEFYPYANYSMGQSLVNLDEYDSAITYLTKITEKHSGSSFMFSYIQDKSNLILGYIYFELAKERKDRELIRNSVMSYSKVSSDSELYLDATLGISYIFIFNRQGNEPLKYLNSIRSNNQNSNLCYLEAIYLSGIAHVYKEKYSKALKLLNKTIELSSERTKNKLHFQYNQTLNDIRKEKDIYEVKLLQNVTLSDSNTNLEDMYNNIILLKIDLKIKEKRITEIHQMNILLDYANFNKGSCMSPCGFEPNRIEILKKEKEKALRIQEEMERLEREANQF